MRLEFKRILKCVPVVFAELINNFILFVEAELALVFIKTDVIDMNKILDDLVMLCFAE